MLISNRFKIDLYLNNVFYAVLLLILVVLPFMGNSQQKFSLEEAVQKAQKSNGKLNLQKLDAIDAEHQLKEYYAIGMPKLTGGVGYNYFLDIPTSILPDFISPSIYGILIKENLIPSKPIDFGSGVPVQFGTKNNLTAKLDLSALIFDGSFFVGLKAQQLYRELIRRQYNMSESDVRYQVTKSYLSALVVKEGIQTLDNNISNLNKVLKDLSEVYKAGFAEKLDVERLELSLQNLNVEREKFSRIIEITENVLKFHLNIPVSEKIELTQKLNDILNVSYLEVMDPSISLKKENRPEYSVMEQGKKLAEINIKRYKVSYLPSVFGFASYQQALQRNKLFDKNDNDWFPTSLVGLNMSVPIFDGFDRKSKIGRAKVTLDKTNLQIQEFEKGIQLEFANAKSTYLNALNTLETRKKSLALAEKIYQTSKVKFKEGIGSSLEITTAERDLYTSQANLLDAQYNLIVAKVELDKALGKI